MAKIELLKGERIKGETKKSVTACNDYLRMGTGRSLKNLHLKYTNELPKLNQIPPTKSLATLKNWSFRFEWVNRSQDYDIDMEVIKDSLVEEGMRKDIALSGYRVVELKKMFTLLLSQLMEEQAGEMPGLWLPDVKGIGSGIDFERIDIKRYNSPLVGDILKVLDDLAKETGGRVHKQEIENKNKTYNVTVEKPFDE